VARLGRGDPSLFTSFARDTLFRFEANMFALFHSLGPKARKLPALVTLVERATAALRTIEERERILALCA
jgi:hypothetical protein